MEIEGEEENVVKLISGRAMIWSLSAVSSSNSNDSCLSSFVYPNIIFLGKSPQNVPLTPLDHVFLLKIILPPSTLRLWLINVGLREQ